MNNGKLGVFWHTQGSGKSYSMVFLAQKIRRKFSGSPTIVVLTDREDLNRQIMPLTKPTISVRRRYRSPWIFSSRTARKWLLSGFWKSIDYSENILIQKSAADLLHDELGWEAVYAYNTEQLGEAGTLGRKS